MNQITEAAEQYYPTSPSSSFDRGEYTKHVTHFLAFMKQRGFEMLKVEGDEIVSDMSNEAFWNIQAGSPDDNNKVLVFESDLKAELKRLCEQALAIGEARGRDKWIRVEEMSYESEGSIFWFSDGEDVMRGYKDGDKYRAEDDFEFYKFAPTHYCEVCKPSPPKTD